ncbi:hypothetical protein DMUE_4113 [Dictyocoela muelleri]|nr:hypothetical protein DMUE_4113 [Dictyocoela muelleri]
MKISKMPNEIILKTLNFTNKRGKIIILNIKNRNINLFLNTIINNYKEKINIMELSKLFSFIRMLNNTTRFDLIEEVWCGLNPAKKNLVLWKLYRNNSLSS